MFSSITFTSLKCYLKNLLSDLRECHEECKIYNLVRLIYTGSLNFQKIIDTKSMTQFIIKLLNNLNIEEQRWRFKVH